MCAGVSSFGFGGTNSRADMWADVEKGPFKDRSIAEHSGADGTQAELTPGEGAKWIKRLLDSESSGTQDLLIGGTAPVGPGVLLGGEDLLRAYYE
eukprot:Skav204930  [mRNA]  locus=scaffold3293:10943:11656:- [translate_table: standard]